MPKLMAGLCPNRFSAACQIELPTRFPFGWLGKSVSGNLPGGRRVPAAMLFRKVMRL
jgi:hypothetical protein